MSDRVIRQREPYETGFFPPEMFLIDVVFTPFFLFFFFFLKSEELFLF